MILFDPIILWVLATGIGSAISSWAFNDAITDLVIAERSKNGKRIAALLRIARELSRLGVQVPFFALGVASIPLIGTVVWNTNTAILIIGAVLISTNSVLDAIGTRLYD